MRSSSARPARDAWWLAAAVLAALLPVWGVFTTSKVFFVRDLAWYFWPRHVWLRATVAEGHMPWWDAYIGGGQSAVADALHQFFLLPVTALRLLAPELVGFNLWVALPFPLAAMGAWLWLRRLVSGPAAFVGASVFALSGPLLSTANFPNLSWSAAFIPWVLWAADRAEGSVRWAPVAALAAIVALQGVSGEAVTFVATGGLVVLHAVSSPLAPAQWRDRLPRLARVGMGVAAGVLLAAVQLLPLWAAASHSPRSQRLASEMWALHPLALLETVQPFFFGQPLDAAPAEFPWITALNSGREPLFYSLYLGLGAVCLAAFQRRHDPLNRWRRFWWFVLAGSVVCALGHYTPVYGAIERVVPVLRSFRYTVKYVLFAAVALAALAATGAEALIRHTRGEPALGASRLPLAFAAGTGLTALVLAVTNAVAADVMQASYVRIASFFALEDTAEGARWLAGPATWSWMRLGALGVLGAALTLALAARGRARWMAVTIWCVFPICDLAVVNAHLNPTGPLDLVAAPAWRAAVQDGGDARVYIGGANALKRGSQRTFVDAPPRVVLGGDRPFIEAHALVGNQYMMSPAAWRTRHIVSQDLADLWPREYRLMLAEVLRRPLDERLRFLRRAGVRYCILPQPPAPGAPPIASLEPIFVGFHLYDCGPAAPRVYVAPAARVEPELRKQLDVIFSPAHDPLATVVLGDEAPAPAGHAGAPVGTSSAHIERESPTEIIVQAAVAAGGGYVTLLDSYDPEWRVTVDGKPARLHRANGVFRAVRVAEGRHEVRFTYRPAAFYAGAAVTLCTALTLVAGCLWERRRRPAAALVAEQVAT